MEFRWAHQADPQAVLFYNDYGDETPGPKANAIEALVRGMLDRHVPIQAVGLQMHISNAHAPTPEQVASIMHVFGNLGLRVDITEMDVSIQDGSGTRAEKLEAQAHIYESIARACLVSSACHVLSTWGVTDRYSWLRQTADSSDAPLLFDEMYQPKPAYRSLMQVLR